MQSKKKDVLVIFVLQETKNSNLFDKNYTLDEVIVIHFEKMKAKNMKNDM